MFFLCKKVESLSHNKKKNISILSPCIYRVEFYTITGSVSTQLLSMVTLFKNKLFFSQLLNMYFSNFCCSFFFTRHGYTLSYLKCLMSIFSASSAAKAVAVHNGKPKFKTIMTMLMLLPAFVPNHHCGWRPDALQTFRAQYLSITYNYPYTLII